MSSDKALKKTSSFPSSDKSRYLPPGLLARGRGKKIQNLYSSKLQLGVHGSSSLKTTKEVTDSSIGFDPLKSCGVPNNPLVRSHTKAVVIGETPFNPKYSLANTVDHCDEENNLDPLFSYTRNNVSDGEKDFSSQEYVNDDSDGLESSDDEDLHPISQPNKSIKQINIEHVPQNVVDGNSTPTNGEVEHNEGEATSSKKKRCGTNKCLLIAKRKAGEKLPISFYNNRVVGENHTIFARHLGIIVRDSNICPIKVRKWKDIGEREKEHMWRVVTDVFSNEDMESYREDVLHHMHELWINRRLDLLRHNVKKKK